MRGPKPYIRAQVRRVSLASTLALALSVSPLSIQDARAQMASLVADQVLVEGPGIVAQGNVVLFFEGVRVTASRVEYNSVSGALNISGPITVTDENGTVMLADAAKLSSDLRNGVLESARLVLDQQLQIAAAEINRVDGRYTQMTKVIASACQVCVNGGPSVPLWAIRSSSVVHDQEKRRLYFRNAQFRVMDIPVFYLPRLSLPDPGVTRATGFLMPSLRRNSRVGTGVRVPYFIALGKHADLTVTPMLTDVTTTLELRYRQVFRAGHLNLEGAVSADSLIPGTTRYYLFADGAYDLPGDFRLSFNAEQVSDATYLSDYGYSDKDRLNNTLSFGRARRDQLIQADIVHWQTLRTDETPIADQLPFDQGGFVFEQRLRPGLLGGEAIVSVSGDAYMRQSGIDVLGRDQARLGAAFEWRRDWILPSGLVASAEAALTADRFAIEDDSNYATSQTRTTQAVAVAFSLPMSRTRAGGVTEILEPMAQLVWSGQQGPDPANEDSVMAMFDPANLFDLSRFPGSDRVETGLRANLGLSYSRIDPDGLSFALAGGKVLRAADPLQFSAASGLDGTSSDWLLAGQVQYGDKLMLQGRALLADDLTLTGAESLLNWQGEDVQIGLGQVWLIADAAEGRPDPLSEITLSTDYQLNENWSFGLGARYDLNNDVLTRADLGAEFKNECIVVDLSVSRRLASSGIVTPSTEFGFSVGLVGIGGAGGVRARRCSG
ncbi:MAG TPA: LPS-assembly protein LptD [Aliiroseovarius sp.]|nr:LPS-assembly protein LptD [Aliiroseovarius sp.]